MTTLLSILIVAHSAPSSSAGGEGGIREVSDKFIAVGRQILVGGGGASPLAVAQVTLGAVVLPVEGSEVIEFAGAALRLGHDVVDRPTIRAVGVAVPVHEHPRPAHIAALAFVPNTMLPNLLPLLAAITTSHIP